MNDTSFLVQEMQAAQHLAESLPNEVRGEHTPWDQLSKFFEVHPQGLVDETRVASVRTVDLERVQ